MEGVGRLLSEVPAAGGVRNGGIVLFIPFCSIVTLDLFLGLLWNKQCEIPSMTHYNIFPSSRWQVLEDYLVRDLQVEVVGK